MNSRDKLSARDYFDRLRAGVQSAEFYIRLRELDPRTITGWPLTVFVDNASTGSLFVWHGSPKVSLARGDSWVVVAYTHAGGLTADALQAWKGLVEESPTRLPDALDYLSRDANIGGAMYIGTGTGRDDFALRWALPGDWVGLFFHLVPGLQLDRPR